MSEAIFKISLSKNRVGALPSWGPVSCHQAYEVVLYVSKIVLKLTEVVTYILTLFYLCAVMWIYHSFILLSKMDKNLCRILEYYRFNLKYVAYVAINIKNALKRLF
jgi:hypothetical protein